MKKRFTLLSVMIAVSSVSFSQSLSQLGTASMKKAELTPAFKEPRQTSNFNQKAGGDPIWSNDFTTAADWTIGSLPSSEQGTWVIGAYPSQMVSYLGAMSNGTGNVGFMNAVQFLINESPANPVKNQNVYIQNAGVIDFSAATLLHISFNQIYRAFNSDKTFIEISADNGATWTSYRINETVAGNETVRNTFVTDVPVPAGTTQGKIRFRWESMEANSGYGWAIDNVDIKVGYDNNVKLDYTFSAVGAQELPYSQMPKSQAANAGKVSFGALASNKGVVSQDVKLNVTPGTTAAIVSPAVTIASLASDSLSILTAGGYTIPSTVGTYNFNYALSSNNPLDVTGDDSAVIPFKVTDFVYAVDGSDGTAASFNTSFTGWASGSGKQEIGIHYEMFNTETVYSIQIGLDAVSSASLPTYVGRNLYGAIYESTQTGFTALEATEEYPVVAADFGKIISLPLAFTQVLEAGKTYLIVAGFRAGDELPVAMSGNVAAGGNVAGSNDGTFNRLASDLPTNNCPVVRLDFKNPLSTSNLEAQFALNVYPNPFNNATEVAFELKNESAVAFSVTDITGREVLNIGSQNFGSGAHKVALNGASLNAGIYNVAIKIGNNVITKRIVKQ